MTDAPAYLANLNAPQRQAVEHVHGPILVLAGAGSGKTRVLTHRVAHLVLQHNVDPGRILAITFTNKATNEMRERLRGLLGDAASRLWVSTFHAAGLRILRRHAQLLKYPNNFAVYDDDDSRQLMKRVLKELRVDEKRMPPQLFESVIDRAKNDYVTAEQYGAGRHDYFSGICAEVYQRYQQILFEAGAMDFGDLLVNTVTLLRSERELLELYRSTLQFILVDEFQDTNHVQYMLIRLLSEPRRNLLVVGDDDQSIYAFRGANVSNILDFERDFPDTKVVTLDQNYRSTGTILEAAYAVISKNTSRKPKKLWTAAQAGPRVVSYAGRDETDEADFAAAEIKNLLTAGVRHSEIAVFYRTNAQSRALEEALLKKRIPYRIFGGLKFYERKEIKDIMAYLRLIANERDTQAFIRALNTPARGIGAQTLQQLVETAREKNTSLWGAAVELQEENKKIKGFVELICGLRQLSEEASLEELISQIIQRTGYAERLQRGKDAEGESRVENLRELMAIGAAMDLGGGDHRTILQAFLDRVALTTSDELALNQEHRVQLAEGEAPQAVSLMTLHLAKGLEFPVVFLTGMEEGLLPHHRSLESKVDVEEERRLCYVGITRAMRQLYLTRAVQRGMFSSGGGFGVSGRYRKVSRFFDDIPPEYLEDRSPNLYEEPSWERDEFSQPDPEAADWWQMRKREAPLALRKEPKKQIALSTADDMFTVPEGAVLLRDFPDQLSPGLTVHHPHFGKGVVAAIDGDLAVDPLNTKVKVLFDKQNDVKTLLLGKAKLMRLEGAE